MASATEVAWMLAALTCTGWTTANLWEAHRDWRTCRQAAVERPVMVAAETEVESQTCFLVVQAIFLLLGIAALLTPEPSNRAVDQFQTLASAVLISAEVILGIGSARARWRRRQLKIAIREAERVRRGG